MLQVFLIWWFQAMNLLVPGTSWKRRAEGRWLQHLFRGCRCVGSWGSMLSNRGFGVLGCPWKLVTSCSSKLVYKFYNLLRGRIQPTYIWAPAKTSDILEQSHQDIDTWYYHETLRNDRGDTKNDDFWNTCLPDFITHVKSSGTMRGHIKNDDHFSHVLSQI